jgi:hypothetical protein
MIYVGDNLKSPNSSEDDHCLINPSLKISLAEPWELGHLLGSRPHYNDIPPQCRGAYLKWLATGRSEPKTHIGYALLFLFGLERRFFFDSLSERVSKEEKEVISEEVYRLLTIYNNNILLKSLAFCFLSMSSIIYNFNKFLVSKLEKDGYIDKTLVHYRLALNATRGEPILAPLAYQSLSLDPEFWLRSPAKICPEEFQALFRLKYQRVFGDGITLKPGEASLNLKYSAANPSLFGVISYSDPHLKEPFKLMSSLKGVFEVAKASGKELEEYRLYLGKRDSFRDSLAAISLLPNELLAESDYAKKATAYLSKIATKWPKLTPLEEILTFFNQNTKNIRTPKDLRYLAILSEKLGYGVIPDARYYEESPNPSDKVVIFPDGHEVGFQPSEMFKLTALIIRFGSIISQCKGEVDPREFSTLVSFVTSNKQLSLRYKNALLAYLFWSFNTPQSPSVLNNKLSGLSDQDKITIIKNICNVLKADHKIFPEELTLLDKIYTAIGLDKSQLLDDMGPMDEELQLITVARQEPTPTFPLPPQKRENAQVVALNEELILKREKETIQVREILDNILINEKEEKTNRDAGPQTKMEGLDGAHEAFLRELLTRPNWKRAALLKLCDRRGLMLDGALELINDWAYDKFKVSLIDDGDPVTVDLELGWKLYEGSKVKIKP